MPRKIKLNEWRYKVAQFALRLIYGRPYHYISPWTGVGACTGLILHCDGKILLSLREGDIEDSGTWSIIGGFLNMDDHETFAQAITRELKEETGLELEPTLFPDSAIKHTFIEHGLDYIELENYARMGVYFWHEITMEEFDSLQTKDETAAFKLVTQEEFEHMIQIKEVIVQNAINAVRDFFERH